MDEEEVVLASITAPDPQGTLCDFYASRGCKNVVPAGAKTRITDKRTETSYLACHECYRYQTSKLSSVMVSATQSKNASAGGGAQPTTVSARGQRVDALALRRQVVSAQRPDLGRPAPKVIDFPTGRLHHSSSGPSVVTPASRSASDVPVRPHAQPGGPYNANHPHLKEDVARWASGKGSSGPLASNTGFRASILVSHYAALPKVKNNQRETDIANVYTTIKIRPRDSGQEISIAAKAAIALELKRRNFSFHWNMENAIVRDPRNHNNVGLEMERGYFEKQLVVHPTGKSATGKRTEYKDPSKQLSLRVVSPADEHERYLAFMEDSDAEDVEGNGMAVDEPLDATAAHSAKPRQKKRPAPTPASRASATASATSSKRPRTKEKSFVMPTFTDIEKMHPLVKTERPSLPSLGESDTSLPTLKQVMASSVPPPSKTNGGGAAPIVVSEDLAKPMQATPAGPRPRMAIADLVSEPTAILSPKKTPAAPSKSAHLFASSSGEQLDAEALKHALETAGSGNMSNRKLASFQDIVEQASIYPVPHVDLNQLIHNENGPRSLLDLFEEAQKSRPLETADLCVSHRQYLRGSFKTSHEAKKLLMHGSEVRPEDHISHRPIVAKRMYYQGKDGVMQRHPVQIELAGLLQEGNLLLWSSSMHAACEERVQARALESGAPSFPLPKLRFVVAAIATVVNKSERGKGIFVHAMSSSYLLEERIDGKFVKYINNSDCRPAANLTPKHGVYYENALYLCFLQHLQYNMTGGLAYVSDYQGNDKVLTDTQIITNPSRFKTKLFGNGNITSAFTQFPAKHQCNKFCEWYGLPPFPTA